LELLLVGLKKAENDRKQGKRQKLKTKWYDFIKERSYADFFLGRDNLRMKAAEMLSNSSLRKLNQLTRA
jgi:hypothetical protein